MSQVTGKQHCFWNNKICECIYENRKSNFSHYIFLLQIINKLNKYILFLYCILINYEFWYTFVILSFFATCLSFHRSWSHGSLICNYLCNQCLSPLKLWVRIPLMATCTRYNIMW
jgi:hypothetical protein